MSARHRLRLAPLLAVAPAVAIALTVTSSAARAQSRDAPQPDSPSSDLYLRRRPPTQAPLRLPRDLEPLLREKEREADARRREAIRLLEELIATNPQGGSAAEALFKLAELYWEEARRRYVVDMRRYEQLTEACRVRSARCRGRPQPPKLDLRRSEQLYVRLVEEHPTFRRIDLVKYLLGFAAREDGRSDEALTWFEKVIAEHPTSTVFTDAWMMIGEHHFGTRGDFRAAREAYAKVLEHPESPVFDLALFKTAWCDWKLGDTRRAAERFKQVLDLAAEAERSADAAERRRRAQLRDEALEYIIVLFSDDESVTAKDAYDFLASIGGERYSREVLTRLADTFFAQARYDRAVSAYQFLIALDELHPDAPKHQIQVVESFLALDEPDRALAAAKDLADDYGPKSAWAKANRDRKAALRRAADAAEATLALLGKRLHEEAQREEKWRRKPDLARYGRAAETYAFYLERFPRAPRAAEIRFLRAEILFFKLGQYERAGDEYLAVGKTAPVGKLHKDALLKAMAAYEKARPKDVTGRRELGPVDRKFAEATDLYATLFPADPEIVTVIFRNGQMFFDYGDYDEAVKRFGLIVTKYPDDPNAGAAGDRILEALVKGEDYENVEEWARKLKQAKAFQSKEEQARLDRILIESIGKSAEKYAAAGHYEKAAGFFLRVAKEYPDDRRAPTALFNAGVVLEKARLPERAAETYLLVPKRYPRAKEAAKAAFTAAQVYEQMAYFDKAAAAYADVAYRYPDSEHAADALFNAGVLEQALGRPKEAIRHYEAYAKRFRDREDVEAVAFRVGVVYEEAKDYGRAAGAFRGYAERFRRGAYEVEAHARAARAYLKLGREKKAAEEMEEAIRAFKALGRDERKPAARWAAEARYLQGELVFKEYARIGLDVKPQKLRKTLDRKSSLLAKATDHYVAVVEFGDPKWATAALYRIGQMYEQFADELRNAPTPPGLSAEEQTVYREELDTYVVDIEDKAIQAYEAGYKKALELRVYNEYTRELREALGRLAAGTYPPEREARIRSRVGDRPPEPPILKDVVRDE